MLRQNRSKVAPTKADWAGAEPRPGSSSDNEGVGSSRRNSSFVSIPVQRDERKTSAALAVSTRTPADDADENGERRRVCLCTNRAITDFMQQRMHAWQPLLSPERTVGIFGLAAIILLALGVLILVTSNHILECKVDYTDDVGVRDIIEIDSRHCTDTQVTELTGSLYFFYELTNYYQNHRRYLKSRSDSQLQGKVYTSASEVKTACDPRYRASDGRVLDPCGLNALSVFTDSFELLRKTADGKFQVIPMDETRDTICWHFDLDSRFKNPSKEEREKHASSVDFWLFEPEMRKALHMDVPGVGEGVENSHFIVWMREAALPNFRKVYGKVEVTPLKLPIYVNIAGDTYDVKSFGGRKYIVISQASWLGGRNAFLGIFYIVVGSVCLAVCLILWYAQVQNPRRMGDILWLRKALYAGS
ncbi:LEM3 (ligand-effect modulator 3) family / CDC50 family protein [Toxoplasma gondii ARI]|uniref:LEM3 (Ligand-effect modulator 3) family / CDC50 family protein n=1 Tax=Toxoplasma gondii ARI TaxID=1074872 RepID=A0A139XMK8_TOXGO|nr:LEM3 (ligand-effect modulator 3) family / CDC50 family protein [Toxoplasma gondii ARI]